MAVAVGTPPQGSPRTLGGPAEFRRPVRYTRAGTAPRKWLRIRYLRRGTVRRRGDAVLHSAGTIPKCLHRLLDRRVIGWARIRPRSRGRHASFRLRGDLFASGGDLHHPQKFASRRVVEKL